MKLTFQQAGRRILFVVGLAILFYEFVIGPHHGQKPDPTIVISSLGLMGASISLRLDGK